MLYEEKVISKETLDEINRLGSVLGEGPLRALCTTVSKDSNILKVFASVLLKSEETVHIAKDILKECGKLLYIILIFHCHFYRANISFPSKSSVYLSV